MNQNSLYPNREEVDDLIKQSQDLRHQDTRQALELCMRSRDLALKIDYQLGFANSHFLVGLCQYILGLHESVIETIQESLSLFQSLEDKRGEGNAYNLIGYIYGQKGLYADAITYYEKSLSIRRQIEDKSGEAGALNNIGIAYTQLSQYADALEHLFNSLDVADSIQEPQTACYALSNIAQVFVRNGDLDKALIYYHQGLELNSSTNDRAIESTILAEIGQVYALLKNHNEAMNRLIRSLELAYQTGNLHDQGVSLQCMGIAYQENGQYLLADERLRSALEIMEKIDSRAIQSEVLCLLGKNYLLQGQYDQAITFLHKSLRIAEEINSDYQTRQIHGHFADIYKSIGNFEEAFHHYHTYHSIWQRLYNRDSEQRIHAILARSEILKAKREAEEHRIKSHELSQVLSQVKKSENEKALTLAQLESQAKMLEQLAREDGLTGLSNRRWLDIQLNQEFERALRFDHPFSIALIDLDDFKSVNDRFSHLIGDEVLRQTAKILSGSCRKVDTLGRYGGEEFLLLLIETTLEQSLRICESAVQAMREYPWANIHPGLNKITFSIGLSGNFQLQFPSEMLSIADEQLYRAKKQGKNQVCSPLG